MSKRELCDFTVMTRRDMKDVRLGKFISLMQELLKDDPEAFYKHCAACCTSIEEALLELDMEDDPRNAVSYHTDRWLREDINARYKRMYPGEWAEIHNIAHYSIFVQDKQEVVCAVSDLVLFHDGQLFRTEVHTARVRLRPSLRTRALNHIQVLDAELLLELCLDAPGVAAYERVKALGYGGLTEEDTWRMICESLVQSDGDGPMALPEFLI